MLANTPAILATLAISSMLVTAAPPACLLAAVNTEPDPTDLQTICGDDAGKINQQIQGTCGGQQEAAIGAFSSICSSAGMSAAATPDSYAMTNSLSASVTTGDPQATPSGITLVTATASGQSAEATTLSPNSTMSSTVTTASHSTMGNSSMPSNGTVTKAPTAPSGGPQGGPGGQSGSPGYYNSNMGGRVSIRHAEVLVSLALVAGGFVLSL